MTYETVIGLETHVQLATESKLFCGCSAKFGASPNTHVCAVCLGLPGTLPVLNARAFEWGIKVALAFGFRFAPFMKFDRKQYFYPDLPKGYQISQFDRPLAEYGHLDITGGPRAVSPLFDPLDTTPINKRKYGVDTASVRAQVDF